MSNDVLKLNPLAQWLRDRKINYAKIKGINQRQVMEIIIALTYDELIIEFDSVCDKEFHSSNKPIQ